MLKTTIPPITKVLAEFVASQSWDTLPEDARECSKQAIADCIGGAIAGATEPPSKVVMELARFEPGNVAIWGSDITTTERMAALANGTLAHAHDIDDTNESMRGHPSAPVVPAIFSMVPATEVGGKALIAAYAVGVEIEAKLGRAMNMEHYERGWHTTSTLGTLGAAAAAANLMGLDSDACARTLAIAGTMACGVRANFGTMTKPLHSGLASEHGVTAARLAAAGLSANPNALEANEGFIDLFCGFDHVAAGLAVSDLGAPFDVVKPGILFKIYPTCSLTHHVLDVLLEGLANGSIRPHQIKQLNCGIGYRCENTLPYHRPTTGLEGKFSMEYCVAAALQYGKVTFAEFSDEAVNAPAIQALYPKLNVYIHPELRERDSVFNDFADIEIIHEDDEVYRKRLYKPKGHPTNPLSWEELAAKFVDCAEPVVGAEKTKQAWNGLRHLETLTGCEIVSFL
ncbi:MmgE/PrpD family protein [uncultured Nitratireductor sp.]|uniref:MmgE/PrpD family protein n=1 Tax=uncultured Nitratireductor sp. TaxID=520953 RepID=UPI0025CE9343|nr:MmgE/PrpD family protein [uncultured Nitratireductor sp.]